MSLRGAACPLLPQSRFKPLISMSLFSSGRSYRGSRAAVLWKMGSKSVPLSLEEALARHKEANVQAECPNMASCPMFPLLSLAGTLKTWKTRYCQGNHTACERYQRNLQGRMIPPDLMPNGVRLSDRSR